MEISSSARGLLSGSLVGLGESTRPRGRALSAGRRQVRRPGYVARRAGRRPDGVADKEVVANRAQCRSNAETTHGSIGSASATSGGGGGRYVAGVAAIKVGGAKGCRLRASRRDFSARRGPFGRRAAFWRARGFTLRAQPGASAVDIGNCDMGELRGSSCKVRPPPIASKPSAIARFSSVAL